MKIAVMGTGGVGGYFGAQLARAGKDVAFVARGEHLNVIQKKGLHVHTPSGNFKIKPTIVTENPETIGTVGLVLFCVKSYDALQAARMIKPMLGPDTVILPLLNGVDHIDMLKDICGSNHVLGGVAYILSNIKEPGVVRHISYNTIVFGEIDKGITPRIKKLKKLLLVDGVEVEAVPNIMERMWGKFAMMCGMGVFTVMRGNKEKILGFDSTRSMIHQAINEVVKVAQAGGIALSDLIPDNILNAAINDFPPTFKPSTLIDLERGNRVEIEALNGSLTRYGNAFGVSTPVNNFIYACLKPYADREESKD